MDASSSATRMVLWATFCTLLPRISSAEGPSPSPRVLVHTVCGAYRTPSNVPPSGVSAYAGRSGDVANRGYERADDGNHERQEPSERKEQWGSQRIPQTSTQENHG